MKKRANLGGDSKLSGALLLNICYVRRFLLPNFITMDLICTAKLHNSW